VTTSASPFLILFGLLLLSGTAQADTTKSTAGPPTAAAPEAGDGGARAAAREALADGNRRLKAGDVAAAIEAYQRAQTLYPPAAPKIEFNIAKAEEARGDTPAAAAAFERFLAQGQDLAEDFRKEARNELVRLAAGLGTLQVDQQRPGLSIVVDGQARGQTPLDHGLWVRPGRHVVTLEQGDRVMFRDSIEIAAGASARVSPVLSREGEGNNPVSPPPALEPLPPAPPPLLSQPPDPVGPKPDEPAAESGDRPIWKRWWFWTGVAAVAAAGTATVLILRARDDCPDTAVCHNAL